MLSKEETIKRYNKLLKTIDGISETDKMKLEAAYKDFSKSIKVEDFKNISTDVWGVIDKVNNFFDEETVKKTVKILAPIMLVFSLRTSIHYVRAIRNEKQSLLVYAVLVSLWISLGMSIFESYKYYAEIEDKESNTYHFFKETIDNRHRLIEKLRNFNILSFSVDFVVTYFRMWYKMIVWQLEYARDNILYRLLFMINVVANVLIIYLSGKVLKGLIES